MSSTMSTTATATIAIVAERDPENPAHREIEAVRPQLEGAGAQATWIPPAELAAATPELIDGLWFLTRHGEAVTDGERAAYAIGHRMAAYGTPILTTDEARITPGTYTGPAADPGLLAFVQQSRARAQARAGAQARQAFEAAEARPRDYVHQMRGPRYRWWRPAAAILLAFLLWLVIGGVLTTVFALTGAMPDTEELDLSIGTSLWMNLLLAALIPAAMIATRVAHWRPWGRLFSVTGRLRWRWMLEAMALTTPLWLLYLTVTWFVFDQEVLPRPEQWIGLLVVTALTIPVQAAGEEVAFRGLLVQAIGAWLRNRWVGLAVSTAITTALFVAAHGSMDVWIWLDLAALAVLGCWLTWRTGGLEAAIALHVVNNLTVSFAGILLGGLEESYVSEETSGSPLSAVLSWVVMGVATALLLWWAQRRGIAPKGHLEPAIG